MRDTVILLGWIVLSLGARFALPALWPEAPQALSGGFALAVLVPAGAAIALARRRGARGWGAAFVILTAGVAALFAVALLEEYWEFYRLKTPVTGIQLGFVTLPLTYLAAASLGVAVEAWARGRGARAVRAAIAGALVAVAVAGGAVTRDVVRTAEARRGQIEGHGSLRPFMEELLGR